MDWLVVYMAAIALVGILLVWFLLRGRIRLFSIGMMLLGLAASLLLYSQTYIFDNWQGVLLAAGGLLVVSAVAYVLVVTDLRKKDKLAYDRATRAARAEARAEARRALREAEEQLAPAANSVALRNYRATPSEALPPEASTPQPQAPQAPQAAVADTVQEAQPLPVAEPAEAFAPTPESGPIPEPEPKPELAPEPESEPAPEPESAPEPEPEPDP